MRLADDKLRQAYATLSAAERHAIIDMLRYVPGGDRAKLQASAMRRIKAQLKVRLR